MKKFQAMMALGLICVSFPLVLFALNSVESKTGETAKSRWADIDLTQFCGKTVAELIDAVGNDYDKYYFWEAPEMCILGGCKFSYGRVELLVTSNEFKYCDRYAWPDTWELADYKKERIDHIEITVRKKKKD
jgi:hypothetical protein